MPEILTISEVADLLKMKVSQVYSMTSARGRARMSAPIPILRLNGNIRFRRQDILEWLDRCAKEDQ